MPDNDGKPSRRGLIGAVSLVPLTALTAAPKQTFGERQFRLIEAIVDRLIPSDENGPGARESGVAVYIDRSFGEALAAEKPSFVAGLETVSAEFAGLNAARQDELLTALERDNPTFFYRIRQLTLEGMFGDPFYGGNRGFAGWDLIRYPGPRMAVSADDQRLREPIKPLRTSAANRGGGKAHGH